MEYVSSPQYFADMIAREGVKQHIDKIAKNLAFINVQDFADGFPKIEEARTRFAEIKNFYEKYKTRKKAEIIEKMLFFYQEELFYFDAYAFIEHSRKKKYEEMNRVVCENDYYNCTDAKFVLVSPEEEGEEDVNIFFEEFLGRYSEKITETKEGFLLNGFFNPKGSKSYYKVKEDEKGKYILRWSDHWSYFLKIMPQSWLLQMQAIPELWAFLKDRLQLSMNEQYITIRGCGNIKTCYWDLIIPFEFDENTLDEYSSIYKNKYFLGKCYLSDFVRNDNLLNY